jgi:hypothetical protein
MVLKCIKSAWQIAAVILDFLIYKYQLGFYEYADFSAD